MAYQKLMFEEMLGQIVILNWMVWKWITWIDLSILRSMFNKEDSLKCEINKQMNAVLKVTANLDSSYKTAGLLRTSWMT